MQVYEGTVFLFVLPFFIIEKTNKNSNCEVFLLDTSFFIIRLDEIEGGNEKYFKEMEAVYRKSAPKNSF